MGSPNLARVDGDGSLPRTSRAGPGCPDWHHAHNTETNSSNDEYPVTTSGARESATSGHNTVRTFALEWFTGNRDCSGHGNPANRVDVCPPAEENKSSCATFPARVRRATATPSSTRGQYHPCP